ncbi:recombinase family protein [Peribacillus simplex]|uniref:recombinase family protein n=1 Tax=Peribacillus simplex TaxID=1478 RepID=UPI002E20286A|nr:recombinase family protein [Peribacillus simplex]MED3987437.1 recombinase family protein [Peribacillus simplex]MED4092859.1 recombinase family protein [Peribacillus simplex]
MNVIKHVAIQLRKSRADGDTDETLETHKIICTRLCEEKGYTYDIYQEVLSGASRLEDRPQLMEMLKNVEAGKYDAVVTTELSRLARSGQYSMLIADILTDANCLIITPKETIDLTVNSQRLMYDIQSAVNTSELRTTNLRMRTSLIEKAKRGEYVSAKSPLGYTAVRVNKKRTLIINEDAEIIRNIYNLAENGYGMKEISKMVGKPYKSIHNILSNKQYMGTLVFNLKDKKGNITESIEYPEAFPAIIPPKQWEKVAEAIQSRLSGSLEAKYRTRGEVRIILKDLVFCGNCNLKLGFQRQQPDKDIMFLKKCSRCNIRGLSEPRLVEEFYKQFEFVEQFFKSEWEKALDTPLEDNKQLIEESIKKESKQQEKLAKRLSNAKFMRMDGELTKVEYEEAKTTIEEELKGITKKITELQKELLSMDKETVIQGYKDKLELIYSVKNSTNIVEANRLLKLLIDKVYYKRGITKDAYGNEEDTIEITIAPR